MVSYRVGDLVFYQVVFLFCSIGFWVVAVLQPHFGFLSIGCHFGALSGRSLINSVCGMGVFFWFGSPGVGKSDSSSGGLQLSCFGRWSIGGC